MKILPIAVMAVGVTPPAGWRPTTLLRYVSTEPQLITDFSDGRLVWSFDAIIFGRGKLKCSDIRTYQISSYSLTSTNIT
jgi:hypothetical protein